MKKITILILTILTAFCAYSQDIAGQWHGVLKIQGTQLRLVFNIIKSGSGYTSTMDSPDQGAKGIPATTVFLNPKLKIEIANAGIEYNGVLKYGILSGTFKQGGREFAMDLVKKQIEEASTKKPQEPVKPYPYYSEDITFQNNKANITLAGTLTMPKKEGRYPVVVLITGSGAQNRDEEMLGHKPFLVIADYLTRNGIAVLRYDDRGFAQSGGNFATATTADFASDAESAVAYLKTRKEIDQTKIGLIGHSEGGIIAPMVAAKSADIKFIVLLAGTGIRGDQLMLLQKERIERKMGVAEPDISKAQELFKGAYQLIVNSEVNDADLANKISAYFRQNSNNQLSAEQANAITRQIVNPWMVNFLKYEPAIALEKVKCAVLALNGEKDLQVPPAENLAAIDKALKKGGNKNVILKEYANLNHLFQECKTCLPTEYATLEQTFSPLVLNEISTWIAGQVSK